MKICTEIRIASKLDCPAILCKSYTFSIVSLTGWGICVRWTFVVFYEWYIIFWVNMVLIIIALSTVTVIHMSRDMRFPTMWYV